VKKSVIAVGIITILIGAMGFGVMVGFTYNTTGYGAISVGTYLSDTTFVYAGLSFPLGIVGGGGMKLGNIFSTDLGKSSEGKNIGKLSISWGALGSVGVSFAYYTAFGAFVGPALFFDWNSDFIEGKLMWYTALGLAVSNYGMALDTSSGIFYRF
jgi:hypothetical protein